MKKVLTVTMDGIRYPDYRKARNEMQELVRAQKNVERFLRRKKKTPRKPRPDKRTPPRNLPIWEASSTVFFSLCSSGPVLRANLHTAAGLRPLYSRCS